jgi:hypothetical protein
MSAIDELRRCALESETLSVDEMTSRFARPVVLAFQPTSFRVLEDPDDLKQWELSMIRRVGLKLPSGSLLNIKMIGTCCDSSCPSVPVSGDDLDTDDCDMD